MQASAHTYWSKKKKEYRQDKRENRETNIQIISDRFGRRDMKYKEIMVYERERERDETQVYFGMLPSKIPLT